MLSEIRCNTVRATSLLYVEKLILARLESRSACTDRWRWGFFFLSPDLSLSLQFTKPYDSDASGPAKDGVWIPGFLAVFGATERDVPRLAWTSYEKVRQDNSAILENSGSVPRNRQQPLQITDVPERPTKLEQYTLKLALSQIHSLWKHTPDLGRGVPVVKVTVDQGATELPPFLFYHGGVRELFHAIRTLAPVSKSRDDPDLYLVNDQSNLLYQSISCAEEFDSSSIEETPGAPKSSLAPVAGATVATKKTGTKEGGGMVSGALSVLSTVGRFARGAANLIPSTPLKANSNIASDSHSAGVDGETAPIERSAEFKTSLGEFEMLDDYAPVKSAVEVQGLAKLVARPERSAGVSEEDWIMAFDSEGRISETQQLRLRELAFSGGIHPTVRREMWKYLLKLYPWDSSLEEREALRNSRVLEYLIYKRQWQTITPMQMSNFRKFRDRKIMIEKDVMRTDRNEKYFESREGAETDSNRYDPTQNGNLEKLHDILLTYAMFNFDTGYCQVRKFTQIDQLLWEVLGANARAQSNVKIAI